MAPHLVKLVIPAALQAVEGPAPLPAGRQGQRGGGAAVARGPCHRKREREREREREWNNDINTHDILKVLTQGEACHLLVGDGHYIAILCRYLEVFT